MSCNSNICLGTAQFGINYGVTGRGEVVPIKEVKQILHRAYELGIRSIDTAATYGCSESNLSKFINNYDFEVVSKIPSLTENGLIKDKDILRSSIKNSQNLLGTSLKTLLFHSATDLLGEDGPEIWDTAANLISNTDIELGVSAYSPEEALQLQSKFPIKSLQLPGNALDQRFNESSNRLNNITVYLRSIFLQGLLLHKPERIRNRVSDLIFETLKEWEKWCNLKNMSLLQGALTVAKSMPNINYYIIGVDNIQHLEMICGEWENVQSIDELPISVKNPLIIDPRNWNI